MQINPYESPRVESPVSELPLGDSDSIRQILIEIRDAQLEMTKLMRDATLRQHRMTRYTWPMILIGLIVPAMMFASIFYRQTLTRTLPATPVPPVRAPFAR